jgi:hypothetical protein
MSTSTIEMMHPCGQRVRLRLSDAFKSPICPKCKRPVTLSFWQKLQARAAGAKKPPASQQPMLPNITTSRQSGVKYEFSGTGFSDFYQEMFGGTRRESGRQSGGGRSGTPSAFQKAQWSKVSTSPSASADFQAQLEMLARTAWTNPGPITKHFLFKPTLPLSRDEAVVERAVKDMYDHARRWATGFEIPYHIPHLRLSSLSDAAGMFKSDEYGWTTIEIAHEFFGWPAAIWLILAHEICHHILNQTGLADRLNPTRNERMTDTAMFICGFGEIALAGKDCVRRSGQNGGYVSSHLGYLQDAEYQYAYHWVIAARACNQMPGLKGVAVSHPEIANRFRISGSVERAMARLKARIPDFDTRQRQLKYYRSKFPGESEESIVERILDDLERDRR